MTSVCLSISLLAPLFGVFIRNHLQKFSDISGKIILIFDITFLLHVEHRVLQAEMYCRYIQKKLLAVIFNKGVPPNIERPPKKRFFKKIET